MRWDERVFGREYDLDVFNVVAVSDFNMGAMENKGLNIFNDKYVLASPETATDADYAAIEAIVAHEYFHNWTGNRITCRDWFQLCLKEGLTVFRDQEFSSDERSRPVHRIAEVRHAARPPVHGGCRPPRPSGAPGAVPGDQQLLHGDRLREGRRGRPHAEDPDRRRGLPARHGPLFRALRRHGRDRRGLPAKLRRRDRARPGPFRALVRAGRHAARRRQRPLRRGGRDLSARLHAGDAADAGADGEGAGRHPRRARPRRARASRAGRPLATGSRATASSSSTARRTASCSRTSPPAPGSVRVPRLLRAGEGRSSSSRTTSC